MKGLPRVALIPRFPVRYWWLVGLTVALTCVFEPYCSTFAIAYIHDSRGLTRAEAGMTNALVYVSMIALCPIFGRLCDGPGRRVLGAVVGALLLLPAFPMLGFSAGGVWLPVALLAVSYSLLTAVIWPMVADLEPERAGSAYGLLTSLMSLGVVVALPTIGLVNKHLAASAANPAGYRGMLTVFTVLATGVVVCACGLRRHGRAARPAPER